LLIGAGGEVALLRHEPDLLLGLDPGFARADHRVDLQPGSTVVLYTDGLVERRDRSVEEGLNLLTAAAAGLAGLPLERLCDALLTRMPAGGEDDIALLGVRVAPDAQAGR
jgi:serine phosphatase RsbU (regulator of sigma subunit)